MMETDRLPYRSPRDKEGHSRSVHDVTNLVDLVETIVMVVSMVVMITIVGLRPLTLILI